MLWRDNMDAGILEAIVHIHCLLDVTDTERVLMDGLHRAAWY